MLKLVFNTLIALFLVLVIFGRDQDPAASKPMLQAEAATGGATASGAESGLIQKASLTDETVGLITPAAAATIPDMAEVDRMPATASAQTHADKKAIITRSFPKVSNSNGLRSSPQYRQEDEIADAATSGSIWTVTAGTLNVRSGPSTSHQRVDGVTRGEEVRIIAQEGNWAHIRIEGDGIDGWVSRNFLTPAN